MQYIIFDFDGTIANTFNVIKELGKELKKEYTGEDVNFDDIKDNEIKYFFKKFKVPLYKLPIIVKQVKKQLSFRIENDIKTFPGMKKVLSKLNDKYKLAILSSNSKENIIKFLQRNKLGEYFEFIHSDSSIFGKHISINNMIKKYNLDPSKIIYVGDEKRDIVACKKSKIEMIAVTWGYNSRKFLLKSKPKYIVDGPSGLLKILCC